MECFTVYADEIEGRIDPSPYHPIRLHSINKIKSCGYHFLLLKEVVEFKRKVVTTKSENEIYIGLENIESDTGDYVSSDEPTENFGSAFEFEKGDILFPKLRPYLNKVHLTKFDGVCSTEFHVLKAIKCDSSYLFAFLNSKLIVNQTSYLMTGNTLPRLQTDEVERLIIPIPNKKIQHNIVQLMDNAYNIKKQKKSEAQQLLDSINGYIFDELGIKLPELEDKMCYIVNADDVKNNRCDAYYYQPKFEEIKEAIERGKYELKSLKEFYGKLVSGQRPKGGVRQISEGVPSLGGEHVLSDGTIATTGLKFIPLEFHKKQLKSKVCKNDIIIVKDGATTGKVGIIPEDYPFKEANVNEHVFLLRTIESVNPYYLFSILKCPLGQIQIKREVTGGTIMGIIRETTEKIKNPLPPLEIQNKIAEEIKARMQKAEQLRKEAKEVLEEAKARVERIIIGEEEI